MKIVHLTDSMAIGGAEKLIALLCRRQREHGHVPAVHCLYRSGVLGDELQREGFEVILHQPPNAFGLARSIYRTLKACRPDVVHCHNATAAILGAIPARLAGAGTVVATRHGLVAPPYALSREFKFALASRSCDWVVAVCEQARQNLMTAPFAARDRITRVYNAAEELHSNGAAAPDKSGFTLLHVGRLVPAKDQETLLHAFAIAKRHNGDLRLWIVGDGPLRVRLETLTQALGLRESVLFCGERSDVAPLFAAADLFVMSSVTEGIPLTQLEALAAGLPSIVTDVGGMAEVAQLAGTGSIVPASNPKALAEAMLKAVQCSSVAAIGQDAKARQCYERHFTPERMVEEYMRLYQGRQPAT